jgi:hypothetical protein
LPPGGRGLCCFMKESHRGRISDHFKGVGTVTRKMVEKRARELAMIDGRDPRHFTNGDFLRAKQELTGVHESVGPEEAREAIAGLTRWDEPVGTSGHRGTTIEAPDEQTIAEDLVDEGLAEAEHEQMVEGIKSKRNQE